MESIGLPQWLRGKESAFGAGVGGDASLIPGSGKIPWRRKCNPLQYLCLENLMNRGVWRATVHKVAKSQTRLKQLSTTHDTTSVLGRKWLAAVILSMELGWSLKAKDINTLSVET